MSEKKMFELLGYVETEKSEQEWFLEFLKWLQSRNESYIAGITKLVKIKWKKKE